MHLVFSYGTLQQTTIQLDLYGTTLEGITDQLKDYELLNNVVYGKYPAVRKALNQVVKGTVFNLTTQQLQITDQYEGEAYKRKMLQLNSGIKAWVYIEN
ncbi:hypothetical protein BUL40_03050 [Croceivirga radicis]|uniref:Gamma-glutamylcyclotransferase AIG2-like domain-containing protein n=1 Tax=Croceivirga radicis TaxID=1929488 RepID=A0A1V6LUC5_9FLAO|nr:gamma-glutamylcyclotransferase family protein [Croceivirga radicis]OQD43606.1 hypothetical protein BUL40_03050 [Croceivirga radicis]